MKKFKYPLAITGTVAEREALIPKLEELGYEWTAALRNDGDNNKFLITNYVGSNGRGVGMGYYFSIGDRKEVPASDSQLVLALAAMVDDNVYHKGEYIKVIKNGSVCGPIDSIHEIKEVNDSNFRVGNKGFDDTMYSNYVRKATAEEIIAHFSKSATTQQPSTTVESLKPYSFIPKVGDVVRYVGNDLFSVKSSAWTVTNIKRNEIYGEYLKNDSRNDWISLDWFAGLNGSKPQFIRVSEAGASASAEREETTVSSKSYYAGGYNPGDWVVCIETKLSLHKKEGDVFQLIEDSLGFERGTSDALYFRKDANVSAHRVRRALPHEIPSDGKPYNLNEKKDRGFVGSAGISSWNMAPSSFVVGDYATVHNGSISAVGLSNKGKTFKITTVSEPCTGLDGQRAIGGAGAFSAGVWESEIRKATFEEIGRTMPEVNKIFEPIKEDTSVSSRPTESFSKGDWVKEKNAPADEDFPVRISKIHEDGWVSFDAGFRDGRIMPGGGRARVTEIYKVEAPVEENEWQHTIGYVSPLQNKLEKIASRVFSEPTGRTIYTDERNPSWVEKSPQWGNVWCSPPAPTHFDLKSFSGTCKDYYQEIINAFRGEKSNDYHQQPIVLTQKMKKRKLIVL